MKKNVYAFEIKCPCCHKAVEKNIRLRHSAINRPYSRARLFKCHNKGCGKFFTVRKPKVTFSIGKVTTA